MKVFFVGAGPGDPDLLTVKARRLLNTCRICIYAGSLVNPEIVSMIPPAAEKFNSAGMPLPEIVAVFRDAQARDLDVVRLHSGDPSIYSAMGEQIEELERLKIHYEVIPGVSAFQASAAALRTELTAPEISQTIILTRISGRTPLPPQQELENLAQTRSTLCIFLSGDRMEEVANRLLPYYGKDCPAAVVYHASWPDQETVRGELGEIAMKVKEADIGKTSMILIGRALSRNLPSSKLYDASFSHAFRQGNGE
jgi:precorrin-4/cobalt-precorrin-4 C11-methyltransferase